MFNFDKQFIKNTNFILAGLDEVGRGSLAGPVVSALVIFKNYVFNNQELINKFINLDLNDSKKISKVKRENLINLIKKHSYYSINFINEKIIDEINILNATKLSMKQNIKKITQKINLDLIIIDGNFKINIKNKQLSIIKGDTKSATIAAASILAKVERDNFITKISSNYPEYDFNKNFGYGTKKHLDTIKKYGPTEIHRKTFSPIKNILTKQILLNI